ncbi:MAG: type II toxin-antitoxin system RelE/ParE family toxin [Alphaproteobacteria bacterium]|nr:type II toxin-antitoxin system RelE/ParE family toxin [Alphaproteobacteria bacterium]
MTGKLNRRPEAAADLVEIWDYIANDDPAAATRMLERIEKVMRRLLNGARLGRPRPELARDIRSIPCKPYVIFYCVTEPDIEIIRVLHGSRDIETLFPGA